MRLLLDTHVFLWATTDPERLSTVAKEILTSSDNRAFLSAASTWEIAIKAHLGRLSLRESAAKWIPSAMQEAGVYPIDILQRHTYVAATLPNYHADPFDRMLISQALIENMSLITADRQILRYEVETIRV